MNDEIIRRVQRVSLEVLLEVDRICQVLGIQYFLDSGTALGAMRHKGFIPWDDDIDIGMLRIDYDRFLNEAPHIINEKFVIQTPRNDKYASSLYAKVRRLNTAYIEKGVMQAAGHNGIWIDIFPFDAVTSNEDDQRKLGLAWEPFRLMLLGKMSSNAGDNASFFKKAARFLLHLLLKVVPYSLIEWRYQKLAKKFAGDSGSYVSLYYIDRLVFLDAHEMLPLSKVIFEGQSFPSFGCPEAYLEKYYGDWKTLPPAEKRFAHSAISVEFDCE